MSTPRDLGPPLDWSDADLDALSTPTSADETAAEALWKRDAPAWAKDLIDAQRGQPVGEGRAQQRVVNLVYPLEEYVEAAQDPADHGQVPRALRRIAPDGREHGIEREGDEERDHHRRGYGDAEGIEELADEGGGDDSLTRSDRR